MGAVDHRVWKKVEDLVLTLHPLDLGPVCLFRPSQSRKERTVE